jgi:hypothetical protein
MHLSRTDVRIHASGFGFAVQTYICKGKKNVILDRFRPQSRPKDAKDSHFKAFPKFSTSSRRNFSASAARDALDRATLALAVATLSYCCVLLSWSRKDRIKVNSLEEAALLSATLEVLATVSYETGQALGITDESCTRGLWSHIVIGNQITRRYRIFQRRTIKVEEASLQHEVARIKTIVFDMTSPSQLQTNDRRTNYTMPSYRPC